MSTWQRVSVVAIVACALVAVVALAAPSLIRRQARASLGLGPVPGNQNQGLLLGRVEAGRFHVLDPAAIPYMTTRLTRIQMQEARSPDSAELDLSSYEGRLIVVQGHDGGGWLYGAHVVQTVKWPLSALARLAF